jgi:hypothetical protein
VGPSATNHSAANRSPAGNSSRGTGFSLCPLICILLTTFFLLAPLSLSQIGTNRPKSEAQQSAPPANSQPAETEKNAAQIELLETKYRFEANGDSRKEVHTRVRINNELGVRQFARLNFDFNRSFQAVEIPMVHITHPSGGIADILPSAITDNPNPAVVDAPAYQDVRVKSVRILGLQPGDLLEYRVITTTTHHPLAPDFWLDHTFDRSGIVSEETFELDLPASLQIAPAINPKTPPKPSSPAERSDPARSIYHWNRKAPAKPTDTEKPDAAKPDISLSTFKSWDALAAGLSKLVVPTESDSRLLWDRASSLVSVDASADAKAAAIYGFVSTKIKTIDLPAGALGFRTRSASEILASGYGAPEDKFFLFAALSNNFFGPARAGFVSSTIQSPETLLASPARFDHLLTMSGYPSINFWMDLNLEVAPFRMIPTEFRNKSVFLVGPAINQHWVTACAPIPFLSSQLVDVRAKIDAQGQLNAAVSYKLRGDNELLLRVAFHQTPREKWKDVAQLLAISDGFRGQITNVSASDPYATKEPFAVEYEITQPKFIDWSKKPVRIPALLPSPGLPDPTLSSDGSSSKNSIDLGTPLEIDLDATITLPEGTTAQTPTGTSVERDYATFSSRYSAQGNTVHATRKLHFISREIPATRTGDLNAFLHAVQADQTQLFTLQRSDIPTK